jgi:creatinine amidohydrolase
MQLAEMTWPQVDKLSRDVPVVIPIAALEQHGHHMPVFTDSMLLGEIVRRAAEPLKDKALFTPLMWWGNSHHHMDFAGTMSAGPRLYLDLLNELMENLLFHGFKRLMFINGHGGNVTPGKQAVFEIRQRHRDRSELLLLYATYWELGNPFAGREDFHQRQMGHACECETSMMLRLAPHLVVGDVKNVKPVEFGFAFEPAYRGWTTKDRTVPGHIGYPNHASVEKGEHLFATYAAGLVTMVERMIAWDGVGWDEPKEPRTK